MVQQRKALWLQFRAATQSRLRIHWDVLQSNSTSLCLGQSVALTADSNASYLWSTGATTRSITVTSSSSTYTVTVTGFNGCTATSSGTGLSITFAPALVNSGTNVVVVA